MKHPRRASPVATIELVISSDAQEGAAQGITDLGPHTEEREDRDNQHNDDAEEDVGLHRATSVGPAGASGCSPCQSTMRSIRAEHSRKAAARSTKASPFWFRVLPRAGRIGSRQRWSSSAEGRG